MTVIERGSYNALPEDDRPDSGLIQEADGTYTGLSPFPSDNLYLTQEFVEYCERTRASWSLFKYMAVCFHQWRRHRHQQQPTPPTDSAPPTL